MQTMFDPSINCFRNEPGLIEECEKDTCLLSVSCSRYLYVMPRPMHGKFRRTMRSPESKSFAGDQDLAVYILLVRVTRIRVPVLETMSNNIFVDRNSGSTVTVDDRFGFRSPG